MADNRTLTFYPAPGGRLELIAGLRAWADHGGRIKFPGADVLAAFDPETHLEPVIKEHKRFNPADLDTLRPIADQHEVLLVLDAPWFTVGIQAVSYHHANPPIMRWSFDPALWGKGPGGLVQADGGLLAFARAAGAAYVLACLGLGYEVIRCQFVRDGEGYRFVIPECGPHRGHQMLWVDVCRELGGLEPRGYVEADRLPRPSGYTRYILAGADADVPCDKW